VRTVRKIGIGDSPQVVRVDSTIGQWRCYVKRPEVETRSAKCLFFNRPWLVVTVTGYRFKPLRPSLIRLMLNS
jgi:hypothetical protein